MAVQTDALDVILRVIGARSFQAAMTESRASVAGLGSEVRKADASMTGLAAKGKIAGDVLATVAKVGILSIGVASGYAIKNSIEFQKQMTLVQTQAGATAGDVKLLHDQVLELARVRPQGPIELAKGLYHFQSVFQNSTAAFEALKIASEGAAVGNANLEETSTALGSALRSQYQHVIPTIAQMKDTMGTLNAIVGAGNMRMDDLTLALGTAVVPAGISAGLTLKDVGGALAVLTDEGQRADNAATHLRMAFTLMSATSEKAKNELAGIGIHANELGQAMHGPGGLVAGLKIVREQLSKKFPVFGHELSNVKDPEQALQLAKRFSVISKAFGGARSSATIMLLLNNLDLLDQKTKQVAGRTGVLDHAFKVWGQTADAKVRVSLSKLQSSLTDFGDSIRDNAVKWITKFIDALTVMVDHIDTVLPILLAFIGAWAALKLAIMLVNAQLAITEFLAVAPTLIAMIGLVTGLSDAFALLGLTIEATPAGWIITAIALLAIAIYLVIKHIGWFKQAAKDVWDWMKAHWAFVMLLSPFLGMIALIGAHWKQLKPIFKAVLDFLSPALKVVGATAKSIFSHILGFIKGMVHGIIGVINFMIRAYNKLPGFMRPTGQIMPIGGWGVNEGPNKGAKLIPGSTPIAFGGPGPLSTGFGPANSIGRMPGGGIVASHSLRKPRSHTPNPEPVLPDPIIEFHYTQNLDGKTIFKNTSKHAANKKARK